MIGNENIRDQRWLSSRDLQLKIDIFQNLVPKELSAFCFLVYQCIGCRSGPVLCESKKFFLGRRVTLPPELPIDAPIFRTYSCVNLIKDVSRRVGEELI